MTQLRRHPAATAPAAPVAADGAAAHDRPLEDGITDCALYEPGGRRPGRLPVEGAAAAARDCNGFVWIGMHEPTPEQFTAVVAEFDLPSLAVDDAVVAHQRPKLELYGELVFAVLKPVRYVDSEEVVDVGEIAFFVGEDFVVTVRHGVSDVLRDVRCDLDAAGEELLGHGPTAVLYRAADRIVDGYETVASDISVDVEEIEAQVFGGEEDDHSQRIYRLKREVLQFRRAVAPLAIPLQRLADGKVHGIDPGAAPFFRDVHDHVMRAIDAIETHDRMLTDVLSADLAQVSVRQNRTAVRQNEDMRKISAWAAIALVPTAIAGIYGMNFENMPELRWEYGYFFVLGLIFVVCFTLHRLFRRNGWL